MFVVGVDLGGTRIKAAAVAPDGRILARLAAPTPARTDPEAVLDALAAVAAEVATSAGGRPRAAGIGVPGILDARSGDVVSLPNFPGWEGRPLTRALAERLQLPTVLENDANVAAVGEHWVGAARELTDFLYVTLGTGVGSGLFLGGKLWRGPSGRAGEFGHLKVAADGPRCGCGDHGCVETFASATALARGAREALDAGRAPGLRALLDAAPAPIDAALVARAARAGDPTCRALFADAGRALGLGLAAVACLLDLERFVLGGGASAAFDLWRGPVEAELRARVFGRDPAALVVLEGALPDDAGVLGAARLAWDLAG